MKCLWGCTRTVCYQVDIDVYHEMFVGMYQECMLSGRHVYHPSIMNCLWGCTRSVCYQVGIDVYHEMFVGMYQECMLSGRHRRLS